MGGFDNELARLEQMSPTELRSEWRRVWREVAPAVTPDLLTRGIAYRLQERRHGGLPASALRQLKQMGREVERQGRLAPVVRIKTGTRLSRNWHGRTYHVLVLGDGFLFEERRYKSLTQIAQEITGANWSGPRFFGLMARGPALPVKEPANG